MNLKQRLDDLIERALGEDRIVGTVILVCEEGQEIYRRAAGYADREQAKPVEDDTIFRLASVSKPIVAATALALIDKGQMDVSAPVTDYIPWFTPALANGDKPEIRIHHLLTHTAGLTYNPDALQITGTYGGLENVSISLEENIRRLAGVPLGYSPGTRWEYGMAIDVLGAVIEVVDGPTLAHAVERHVTGPLGMKDTHFGVLDETRLSVAYANSETGTVRMSDPHEMDNPWGGRTKFEPGRIFNPDAFQSGGAGMSGPAPDFMKLLEALQPQRPHLLSADLTQTALANQTGDVELEGRPGEAFSYLGAYVAEPRKNNNPQSPGTVRWGGIYGNSWFLDPARRLSVAGFTNTAFEGSDGKFREELREAVYGWNRPC